MTEEEKWQEEFEKEYEADNGFWENLPNKKDTAKYFYLQACKVRQKDEVILELAFKDRKFSGIIIGDRLIETGEVVEYIRKGQEKFNTFYQNINEDQAKLATYLNLPGDGRMLSEQVIEAFGKRQGEIGKLRVKINHLAEDLKQAIEIVREFRLS